MRALARRLHAKGRDNSRSSDRIYLDGRGGCNEEVPSTKNQVPNSNEY